MIRRPPRSTLFPSRRSSDLNDRPYVASSFLSVAIARVFGSAMKGGSKDRPELAASALPFEIEIATVQDRKSTRLNSSHGYISYAVFCLKKKKKETKDIHRHT